jgi:hypothetical protein
MSSKEGRRFGLERIAENRREQSVSATADERRAFGLGDLLGDSTSHRESVYVVLKYYDSDHECLSSWKKEELKDFSNFVHKLRQLSWNNLPGGLRPKPCRLEHARNDARERLKRVCQQMSGDIQFIELRVSQRARVHGFRMKSAFFLVLLDRDHQVFPE